LAAALAVYIGALRNGLGEADVRTLTFTTLVVANLALIVTNRSLTRSVFEQWRTPNRVLAVLGPGALLVLAAVLFVPVLRDLFRVAAPHTDDLLIVAGAGLASLMWTEIAKRVMPAERKRERRC
jgi:P-type Ca2+ transporter type 2C